MFKEKAVIYMLDTTFLGIGENPRPMVGVAGYVV